MPHVYGGSSCLATGDQTTVVNMATQTIMAWHTNMARVNIRNLPILVKLNGVNSYTKYIASYPAKIIKFGTVCPISYFIFVISKQEQHIHILHEILVKLHI